MFVKEMEDDNKDEWRGKRNDRLKKYLVGHVVRYQNKVKGQIEFEPEIQS